MKALFSGAAAVPAARVVSEHKGVLAPVAVLLGVAIALFAFVVLPLSQAVAGAERRAEQAAAAVKAAEQEMMAAEATRDGKMRAGTDLDTFYGEVLPADVAAARRVTHLKLAQLAREHGVTYERSTFTPESARGSALERLRVTFLLSGDYDDIRAFIYDLETAPDFVVIDNVVLSEGEDQQAPLSLDIQLSTYYRAKPDGDQ